MQPRLCGAREEGPPLSELHCSRTTHECKALAPTIFGGGDWDSFGFKLLANSRLDTVREGTEWIVTNGDSDRSLGGASEDAAQIAQYRRLAADFQAFLTDPSRDRFDATYQGIGMTIPWMTVFTLLLAIGALYFAFRWWYGWAADLTFDRAAGTVRIDRRPMFVFGNRHRTLHLAGLVPVVVNEERVKYMPRYGPTTYIKFVRIELHDGNGDAHFSYSMPYDEAGRPAADQRIAAIRSYFPRSA